MSNQQKTNFRNFKALLSQLRSYGLNPRDWKVVRESLAADLEQIEMYHRHDQDFSFRGQLDRSRDGRAIIAGLTLISI
jgi:hypothetical protein